MTRKVKVEGLRELDQALGELARRGTARTMLYRVLFKAAAPIDAAWRAKAPVDKGHLHRSGGIQKSATQDFNRAYSSVLSVGGDKAEAVKAGRAAQRANASGRAFAELVLGPGRNPQAVLQEFGTAHHPPQPFMRPAWDETQDVALEIIKDELTLEIFEATLRLSRRAARARSKAGS